MKSLVELIDGKKHIIWDWNGTLINDVDHAVSTMNVVLEKRGLSRINRDYYTQIFEFPVINYYKTLGFDFTREPFEKICHEFVELYMNDFQSCPLAEGVKETLDIFKERGIRQSILSASDQQSLNEMVLHFELNEYFSSIFGVEDKFAASKSHRGREIIQISKIALGETVLIGDTEHDLEVGDYLGIDVVLVGHGHQCPNKLKQKHHSVVH